MARTLRQSLDNTGYPDVVGPLATAPGATACLHPWTPYPSPAVTVSMVVVHQSHRLNHAGAYSKSPVIPHATVAI